MWGSYTYSDRTDDPEGASIYKWYAADDNTGTNKAEITAAAGKLSFVVTEDLIGKYLYFEVTPVATIGTLLEGDAVEDTSMTAVVTSSNDLALERLWLGSTKTGAAPPYINPSVTTERGMAVGQDHIYIASRYGDNKIVVVDKTDGSYLSELDMTGVTDGIYAINDVEVSDDGQILAAPLVDGTDFWIYKWENELAAPVKWLEVTLPEQMRLGDKFSVTGDLSGSAIIMAAKNEGDKIVRWVVSGGVAGSAEIITLTGLTSMGTAPAVIPFSPSSDANMLIDGKGLAPRVFDKDGNQLGYIARIDDYANYKIQSNSPNVFQYKGRTMAAFFQAMRQEPLGARIIVADITSQPYQIIDTSEYISDNMPWDGYLGEVDVTVDNDYYYLYMLQAKNALGAYRGELQLPAFVSAITAYAGDMVYVKLDQSLTAISSIDETTWTITAGGTGITIDSIQTSNDTVWFDLATAIVEGEAVTVSYDGTGGIQSFNGMPLAAFGPESVENIVGADVPVATNVSISGEPSPGSTLTGSYTFDDPDGDAEGTSTYQWWVADDDQGAGALKIIGELSTTYTVSSDLLGNFVAFQVTPVSATGGADYLVGEAVVSDWVQVRNVGISNNNIQDVTLYPNPVHEMLTISNASTLKSVSIIDITGKVLFTKKVNGENMLTMPVSDLSSGFYYIRLKDNDDNFRTEKIVKID